MDSVVITNAGDLSATDFACYMNGSFSPVAMAFVYDNTKKTLTLSSIDTNINVTFDDFRTIHFGNSKLDINLCNPLTYTYKLSSGLIPNLDVQSVSFELTNRVSKVVLPDLKVNL